MGVDFSTMPTCMFTAIRIATRRLSSLSLIEEITVLNAMKFVENY